MDLCLNTFLPGNLLSFTMAHSDVYSLITVRMHEGSENPFLLVQIIGQKYRTKCNGTILSHPPYRSKIVCFVVLVSMLLFALAAVFLDTEVYLSLSSFTFFFCTISYRSQKSLKDNEVVPQRMSFWYFVRSTDCSLAPHSMLFFLFFQSVPMLLIAISAGMNFSLLVPSWVRLCIERCVLSFLSLVLDFPNHLNYLKE